MQPYQEASEEIRRQNETPGKAFKSAAKTGIGLAAGGATFGRIAPLLSKLIPRDLAAKGLEKISPKLGKFVKNMVNNGYTIDDALDFLKDTSEENIESKENKGSKKAKKQTLIDELKEKVSKTQPKMGTPLSVLSQYDQALAQKVEDEIGKGKPPRYIAGQLKKSNFRKIIEDIEGKTGVEFSQFLNGLYNPDQQQQGQSKAALQAQPQQQPQGQAQPGQQQQGGGDQALLAALDKILKM